MTDNRFLIGRRTFLGGVGAALLVPSDPARAQTRAVLTLEAVPGTVALKPDQPPTPVWQLAGGPDAGPLRFGRGATVDVTLTNRLPVSVALSWRGLDGNPGAAPFVGRPPVAPGKSETIPVAFRHAGTLLAGLIVGDAAPAQRTVARAVIVSETEPLQIDRDEVMLFQGDEIAITVNGRAGFDLTLDLNQRLRLRLINALQHVPIAIRFAELDMRVVAIDGQPSEPFLARDGLVVLAPGSRVDAVTDVVRPPKSTSAIVLLHGRESRPIGKILTSDAAPVRPAPLPAAPALPGNGLPAQLDLKSALRIDLPVGTAEWPVAFSLTPASPPAFKVKRGRTVVLAATNRGPKPLVLNLHGHHARLLDRLDDGWKPFWLDTLMLDAGQTQRLAFLAEHPGTYLLAWTPVGETATARARSYLVE